MNKSHKVVVGVIAAAGLGLAVASAYADPHGASTDTGPHAQGGMQHGMKGAMGPGAMGHGAAGQGAEHAGLTPEERTALQEKMRNAKTPEERQKIAGTMSSEMQKRVQAKDASHSEHRGPGAGSERFRGNTNESHSH